MAIQFKPGLEGIIAAKTELSFIDGKRGILEYRGYDINDLAARSNFEEVTYLLWFGKLPTKKELGKFSKELRSQRGIDFDVVRVIRTCNFNIDAMDALRSAVSYIAHCDPDLNDNSFEANIRKGSRLAAQFPTIVASFYRIRKGKKPVQPDPKLSPGANFLYMLRGEMPDEIEARAMDLDFLLTAEHELNASSFAARVAVSTSSDLHSAVCSAIGTLKGPLHGGARAEVYKMMDKIGKPERAAPYVKELLAKGKKAMGFGHRVYKTFDPRAKIFKRTAYDLARDAGDMSHYDTAAKVEETVIRELVEKAGKPVYTNVDFYTGAVYKYLQIPPQLATSIFALGRIAGWVAHALEQYADNRLIRPLAEYTGPHKQTYVPIENR